MQYSLSQNGNPAISEARHINYDQTHMFNSKIQESVLHSTCEKHMDD